MSCSLDEACAQLRALLHGTDSHIELAVCLDGRVVIRRVSAAGYTVITQRADVEPGGDSELPSAVIRRMA